jgi:hypothetical protein
MSMAKAPEAKVNQAAPADEVPMDLTVHPVLQKIKPKPCDEREFFVLTGYVGDTEDDIVRVYPTLNLGTYYEIPEDSIVAAEKVDPNQKLSRTILIVECNPRVKLVTLSVRNVEAGFLSGSITEANLGSAISQTARSYYASPVSAGNCVNPEAKTNPGSPFPTSRCWKNGVCASDGVIYEPL